MREYDDQVFKNRDGLSLNYHDYNSAPDGAPVIVCIPGLTRNLRDFQGLAIHLKERARVLTLSLRGRGRSEYDPDPSRYSPPTYVGDVLDLLDHVGADSAHFVGTSLGGLVTMLTAYSYPDRLKSAILNDIGPTIEARGIEKIQGYVGKLSPVSTWDDAARTTKALAGEVFPDFTHADWLAFARQIYVETDETIQLDYDPNIAVPFKESPEKAAPDLWPVFDGLSGVPTLVVRGGTSDILSAETVTAMEKVHASLSSVTVPRVGHAPLLTEPECLAAILGFYDRIC